MITITIKTDNAAFGEGSLERGAEVGRILRELALEAETGDDLNGPLLDSNGNRVGDIRQTKR